MADSLREARAACRRSQAGSFVVCWTCSERSNCLAEVRRRKVEKEGCVPLTPSESEEARRR